MIPTAHEMTREPNITNRSPAGHYPLHMRLPPSPRGGGGLCNQPPVGRFQLPRSICPLSPGLALIKLFMAGDHGFAPPRLEAHNPAIVFCVFAAAARTDWLTLRVLGIIIIWSPLGGGVATAELPETVELTVLGLWLNLLMEMRIWEMFRILLIRGIREIIYFSEVSKDLQNTNNI